MTELRHVCADSRAGVVGVIGLQTLWISRSLGRLETGQDALGARLDGRIGSLQAASA